MVQAAQQLQQLHVAAPRPLHTLLNPLPRRDPSNFQFSHMDASAGLGWPVDPLPLVALLRGGRFNPLSYPPSVVRDVRAPVPDALPRFADGVLAGLMLGQLGYRIPRLERGDPIVRTWDHVVETERREKGRPAVGCLMEAAVAVRQVVDGVPVTYLLREEAERKRVEELVRGERRARRAAEWEEEEGREAKRARRE